MVETLQRLSLLALSLLSSGKLEGRSVLAPLGPCAAKVAYKAAQAVCRLPVSETCGRIRFLEGEVVVPSSSSLLARALACRHSVDESLDTCLRSLRQDFGYQVESQKKIGALDVEGGRVDLPSSSSSGVSRAR
jgi:hypothetical protein